MNYIQRIIAYIFCIISYIKKCVKRKYTTLLRDNEKCVHKIYANRVCGLYGEVKQVGWNNRIVLCEEHEKLMRMHSSAYHYTRAYDVEGDAIDTAKREYLRDWAEAHGNVDMQIQVTEFYTKKINKMFKLCNCDPSLIQLVEYIQRTKFTDDLSLEIDYGHRRWMSILRRGYSTNYKVKDGVITVLNF